MGNGKKKADEMDVFMVRLMDFITDALNDPKIVLENTPLYRAFLASVDLVTKNPEIQKQIKMPPVDMKEAMKNLGDQAASLQKQALLRLQVAATQQDVIAAQNDLNKASLMYDVLSEILKQQGADAQKALQVAR